MTQPMTALERKLTNIYTKLCIKIDVPLYKGRIYVIPSGWLNGHINFIICNAEVTTYDVCCLNHADLVALMVHEVGHLRAYDNGSSLQQWVIKSSVLRLASAIA